MRTWDFYESILLQPFSMRSLIFLLGWVIFFNHYFYFCFFISQPYDIYIFIGSYYSLQSSSSFGEGGKDFDVRTWSCKKGVEIAERERASGWKDSICSRKAHSCYENERLFLELDVLQIEESICSEELKASTQREKKVIKEIFALIEAFKRISPEIFRIWNRKWHLSIPFFHRVRIKIKDLERLDASKARSRTKKWKKLSRII